MINAKQSRQKQRVVIEFLLLEKKELLTLFSIYVDILSTSSLLSKFLTSHVYCTSPATFNNQGELHGRILQ